MPLTAEYIDVAVRLLRTLQAELGPKPEFVADDVVVGDDDSMEFPAMGAADIELGVVDELNRPETQA